MSQVDQNESQLNQMLTQLMHRQGVQKDSIPNIENWSNFLGAIDQKITEFESARSWEIVDDHESLQLKQLYEDLKNESDILEKMVAERTAELENARIHLERVNRRLEYDAHHDGLTGAKNRNFFMRVLKCRHQELQRGELTQNLGLFFIDFDRFKQINDTLGHHVGDRILVQVANRLSAVVRHRDDCFARLGGDEFVLLTSLPNAEYAKRVAHQISDAFVQPVRIRDVEITISASIGVVLAQRGDHSDFHEVIRDADIAMYRAKQTGDSFRLFDGEMRREHLERIELENQLELAITQKQFDLNFEPIVNTARKTIYSVESLVRWNHPTKGRIPPAEFIPLAEELGLVIDIDRIVFEKTCEQYSKWHDEGNLLPDQKLNVNLAPGQLERADLVPFLLSTIDGYGIEAQNVVLEITESHLLADSGPVIQNINQISNIGFKLFVDDFGTGYSSLSYLSKYPIDGIKIDRSFVRDALKKVENRELIRSIIAMAKALNVTIVTEGVESLEQLKLVTELGCDNIQGFLFTMPLSATEATEFLDNRSFLATIAEMENQPDMEKATAFLSNSML